MNRFARTLMVGSLLWYCGEGMFGPLLAVFTKTIGGDVLDITWAWAIYLMVTGIVMLIAGKLSDVRVSKQTLMIVGFGLNTVFTFGYLLISDPLGLFIVQAGLGIAWALATPTWDALYARRGDRKNDGAAWGFADGLPQIVTAISILLGGLISVYGSFRLLFFTMGTIQALATIYEIRILATRMP